MKGVSEMSLFFTSYSDSPSFRFRVLLSLCEVPLTLVIALFCLWGCSNSLGSNTFEGLWILLFLCWCGEMRSSSDWFSMTEFNSSLEIMLESSSTDSFVIYFKRFSLTFFFSVILRFSPCWFFFWGCFSSKNLISLFYSNSGRRCSTSSSSSKFLDSFLYF